MSFGGTQADMTDMTIENVSLDMYRPSYERSAQTGDTSQDEPISANIRYHP